MKYLLMVISSFFIVICYGGNNSDLLIHVKNESDTTVYNYKEFTDSILVGSLNDVMIAKEEVIKCNEAQISLQQKFISIVIFALVGIISFPAFIVFLVLYIRLRKKTKNIPR